MPFGDHRAASRGEAPPSESKMIGAPNKVTLLRVAVGPARVGNPSREMAVWARTRQWAIERWKQVAPRVRAQAECQPVCEKIGVQR